MKNFVLTIEYDGTGYKGWQRQAIEPTIQAAVEGALAVLTRSAVVLIGAGRTDAGVHAVGQVANFRSDTRLEPESILKGLNSLLPADIAVRDCRRVSEKFHARFDAKRKVYHYRILNRKMRMAVGRNYAWFIHRPLDWEAMQEAAAMLVGRHDFKAFENTGSPRAHTVRHVVSAGWRAEGPDLMTLRIEADGFLRCMVRNIVGTLVAVGVQKIPPEEVRAILSSRDRCSAGSTAPPHGLFLMEVSYGDTAPIPTADFLVIPNP